jgi:hypothetical protein
MCKHILDAARHSRDTYGLEPREIVPDHVYFSAIGAGDDLIALIDRYADKWDLLVHDDMDLATAERILRMKLTEH